MGSRRVRKIEAVTVHDLALGGPSAISSERELEVSVDMKLFFYTLARFLPVMSL